MNAESEGIAPTTDIMAVLGAGTMGHGIAQVAALAGFVVRLHDPGEGAVAAGMKQIEGNLKKGVSLGKVTPDEEEQTLGRLHPVASLADAVSGARIVVEAAPERLELKRELFQAVEAHVAPDTLLATNTSSLSIGDMARPLRYPERFLGLHFFNPVHIMALVEVVHGPATSDDTTRRGIELTRRLHKEPIVVRDSPGFASSRLGIALGLEAIRMVEDEVASAEDIDRAMTLGYRHPMGPLRLTDLVGLDVRLGIAEYLHETLGQEQFRPPSLLRQMVEDGHLGRKSGRGFYNWEDEG